MPKFEHGLKRGTETAVYGFIVGIIIRSILQGFGREDLLLLFVIINAMLIIVLLNNMKYWGIGYTFGWVIGIFLFIGLVPWWEIFIYIIFFIIAIFFKFKNRISRSYF